MSALKKPILKNTLYLHKIKLSDNQKFLNEIKKQFESADYYLDTSGKVVIGNKIKFNHIEVSFSDNLPALNMYNRGMRRSLTKPKFSFRINNSEYQLNPEVLNAKKIKNIFENLKLKEKNNNTKEKINKGYLNLPDNIKHKLNLQERSLIKKQQEEIQGRWLSNLICRRSNKKPNQLLMNSIEGYRLKREILDNIYKKKKKILQWKETLRNFGNFKEGTKSNSVLDIIKDNSNQCQEISLNNRTFSTRKSIHSLKQKFYSKMLTRPDINKLNINNSIHMINQMDNMDNMEIKGKNLLLCEYNNAISLKGKIILKKNKDELSKKFINREIVYSNYNNSKSIKNIRNISSYKSLF